jgi:hypothetical protein
MGTRSRIAIKLADNEIKSVYCHWDGYPSGNGRTLVKHYNSKEKALNLIMLGDLSSLHESTECPEGHTFDNSIKGYTVAYGRDRGETGCEAKDHYGINDLINAANNSDGEYIYLYDCTKSKWYFTDIDQAVKKRYRCKWKVLNMKNTRERKRTE